MPKIITGKLIQKVKRQGIKGQLVHMVRGEKDFINDKLWSYGSEIKPEANDWWSRAIIWGWELKFIAARN